MEDLTTMALAMPIINKVAPAIFQKIAVPTMRKTLELSTDAFEKFSIEFNLVFTKYLLKTYEKYSKIKTILQDNQPKYIYDFYEIPIIKFPNGDKLKIDDINTILEVSQFTIIQGTGGMGKSTLMKHLFLSELSQKNLIPIFYELKDLNDNKEDYDLIDLIYEKLDILGSHLKREYIEYCLDKGIFLFLFDGYDEIISDKKVEFYKKFEVFCDKFSKCSFILSSRKCDDFISFQRFSIILTEPLTKEQALSLIHKIEFDVEAKSKFALDLNIKLYEKHRSFASNPLLLNIMLLTYEKYVEIPENLHEFYSNAFDTMYSRHDRTKGFYKREKKSKLSQDTFINVFSYFCYITYSQGKIEMTQDEVENTLKKIKVIIDFDVKDYMDDLVTCVCVLNKEGWNYQFTHRSFQEYFTALLLKKSSDKEMEERGVKLILSDINRANRDEIFEMLFPMDKLGFEKNIILPIIADFEKDYYVDNKYDYYFTKDDVPYFIIIEQNVWEISVGKRFEEEVIDFLINISCLYKNRSFNKLVGKSYAEEKIIEYIRENNLFPYKIQISRQEIFENRKLYDLFKSTQFGECYRILSTLKLDIEERQKKQDKFNVNILEFNYLLS